MPWFTHHSHQLLFITPTFPPPSPFSPPTATTAQKWTLPPQQNNAIFNTTTVSRRSPPCNVDSRRRHGLFIPPEQQALEASVPFPLRDLERFLMDDFRNNNLISLMLAFSAKNLSVVTEISSCTGVIYRFVVKSVEQNRSRLMKRKRRKGVFFHQSKQ
ncbi:hypothetical protein LXL04_026196 [Taraxacum kok-saghyz]